MTLTVDDRELIEALRPEKRLRRYHRRKTGLLLRLAGRAARSVPRVCRRNARRR
jgi:hypothetical protein